jgi:hypothetical protein
MTLDAGDEQFVHIRLRVLDEVGRGLFGGYSDQGYSLVRWLKPHNLGTLNRSPPRLITTITFTFTPFRLLLLFGSSR